MANSKQSQYDRLSIGWLLGTILPVIVFLIIYLLKYREMEFVVYVKNMWYMKVFLKILSLSVFPNLGLFFIFYKQKKDMAARGVILATFMYAFLVMIAKLI